eukprot:3700988-Rhodomonas_salina.1
MQCSFVLAEAKALSLAKSARGLLEGTPTPRDGAKWRGALQWYGPCLEGTRILTRGLNAWIGSPKKEGWDVPKQLSKEARAELEFWSENLPAMAGCAKPMWKLSPQEILRRFKAGERVVDATISTDASWMGWGAILEVMQEDATTSRMSTSGRWGAGDDSGEQAHREACGTLRALETFLESMQGRMVLHLTDCVPVSSAMGSGSKDSE